MGMGREKNEERTNINLDCSAIFHSNGSSGEASSLCNTAL